MGRKLLVAAVSARPYVALAVAAGYQVTALDIFADVDTQAMAQQVLRLPYQNGGFEPQAFAAVLDTIVEHAQTEDGLIGMVYGSGFESHPELLHMAEQKLGLRDQSLLGKSLLGKSLIGNSVDSVRRAKSGVEFFDLLRRHDILHPETRTQAPDHAQGWLCKRMGGSGGTQIRRAPFPVWHSELQHGGLMQSEIVYQREVSGIPVSLLFLAHGQTIDVIGYNQQFCHPGQDMPFRYGGLVSQAPLDEEGKLALQYAAQRLTTGLSLKGLNSLDAIWAEDGRIYVLELNPRLTASTGLYEVDIPLMDLHIRACRGIELPEFQVKKDAHALAVCYAPREMKINAVAWPEWVADIPPVGTVIQENEPCCTVRASAESAAQAWQSAQARMASLFQS